MFIYSLIALTLRRRVSSAVKRSLMFDSIHVRFTVEEQEDKEEARPVA